VRNTVLFILKGYPRLSETFIAQEIHALEQRGLAIRIASLRHPTDRAVHPVHREIRASVSYLPEYLYQEPLRVLRAWWRLRRMTGYAAAWRIWLADLRRDLSPNRVRRFGQALVLAHELTPDVDRLHAHFLHTPASVARYASLLTGLPWSCSAHAKDIWTTPEWEKREKLAALDWLVTCTAVGHAHLRALADHPERIELVYHGLDFTRFTPPPGMPSIRDGRDPANPVIILSVGRAVAKKGYDDLVSALARLPADLAWRFVHVGGGPMLADLKRQAVALGIASRMEWLGAQPQEIVLQRYRQADLFVLASRIAVDGDRDGLPNVLMEAQSQRLAIVASRIAAVPELIEDGVTGLLVPLQDLAALTAALATLIQDPAQRARLAAAGFELVHRQFDMQRGIDQLTRRFGLVSAEAPSSQARSCA
jgi:glycosyltransferase involved in cell wall biosynthesis